MKNNPFGDDIQYGEADLDQISMVIPGDMAVMAVAMDIDRYFH